MATQLGKITGELTEAEKTQARVNVVMEAGANITGTYAAAMETMGKQLTSLPRITKDVLSDNMKSG